MDNYKPSPPAPKKNKAGNRVGTIISILLLIIIVAYCNIVPDYEETRKPAQTSADVSEFELAEQTIVGYDEVTEAAINMRDGTMSLAIVVKRSTSESRAKELGSNFVRITMSLANGESSPSKEIGKSRYDYLIGVYYSDGEEFITGAKVRRATRVSW